MKPVICFFLFGLLMYCPITSDGSSSQNAETITQDEQEHRRVVIDTTDGDPNSPVRYYDPFPSKSLSPPFPFVDLDTTTREKKLWISEKKLISHPVRSRHGRLIARDSMVFVVYPITIYYADKASDRADFYTYSFDYGKNWSEPQSLHLTVETQGRPSFVIKDDKVLFTYALSTSYEDYTDASLFKTFDFLDTSVSDSSVVDVTHEWWEPMGGNQLLQWADTLFASYYHHLNGNNEMKFKKSLDWGKTWIPIVYDPFTTPGYNHSFLLTDSVLSEVQGNDSIEICIHRSFDGGYTWAEETHLSPLDNYAGQGSSACTDGSSDIHVTWYDHLGSPGGSDGWLAYRRTLDNGQTWEETRGLSLSGYANESDIWSDTNIVYAVYNDSRAISPDYAIFLRYSFDRGDSWSPEIMVVDSTDPAWFPQIHGWENFFYLTWHEQHPPDWLWGVYYIHGGWYTPGDVDNTEEINVADLTYLVSYLFLGGNEPPLLGAAEMDGIEDINVSDLTYLVGYLFLGGPSPVGAPPP